MSIGGLVWDQGPTLEVRWIRRGTLASSMIEWFSPFCRELESREDAYVVGRRIQGLSVKIRGGARLEVKVALGDRGVLDMPGRARGRLESWQKWSFPIPPVGELGIKPPDWVPVGKVRRTGMFAFADGRPVDRAPTVDDETTCAVELTEVMWGEEPWWTLGLEARGDPETVRAAIEATAALVFRDRLPGGRELGAVDSMSYSEWLRHIRTSDPGS